MKSEFENEMKLEFISKSSNEAFARITVAAFASQLDPTIEELADIKTAVSEAVTNCIIHGYDKKQGIVKIFGRLRKNEIILEISDKGKGIENVEIAKEPLYTTKPNLERSGMGFTIMESFMDKVTIESVVGLGTKVTMSKIIKSKTEEEEADEEFEMITKEERDKMFENSIEVIKRAQSGDKYELERMIKENNRTNMEYCKKI